MTLTRTRVTECTRLFFHRRVVSNLFFAVGCVEKVCRVAGLFAWCLLGVRWTEQGWDDASQRSGVHARKQGSAGMSCFVPVSLSDVSLRKRCSWTSRCTLFEDIGFIRTTFPTTGMLALFFA